MCCTDCRTRYWPARPPMLFRASAPSAEHRWRIISQVSVQYRSLYDYKASSDVFCLMLNFYAHFLTRQNLYLFCTGQDYVFSVSLMIDESNVQKSCTLFHIFFVHMFSHYSVCPKWSELLPLNLLFFNGKYITLWSFIVPYSGVVYLPVALTFGVLLLCDV